MADSDVADPRLLEVTPKALRDFKVIIHKYNDTSVDITRSVMQMSIYESITSPLLYGSMQVIDNSAMASTFPFIGQERVEIHIQRKDKRITKLFYVSDVNKMEQLVEATGTYALSFTSEKQYRNAISLFSKAYRGNSSDIIQKIHKEFLGEDLTIRTKGATSHNIVFPYIKPLAAISMLQQNVLAEDNTPFFIYESLFGSGPVLDSLKNMLEKDPVVEISAKKPVNTDDQGTGTRTLNELDYQIESAIIERAYDTLNLTAKGAFASTVTSIDLSSRKAEVSDFTFRDHAPPLTNDWVSSYFAFDDNRIHTQYNTRNHLMPKNSMAYNEDFPNLTGLDDVKVAIIKSYMNRLKTVKVAVHMNSAPELEIGMCVDYHKERFSPKFNPNEDVNDKVFGGKYLIGAIHHYIDKGEYSMSLELIRDGMGQEGDLYGNEVPNLGAPPREKKPIGILYGRDED